MKENAEPKPIWQRRVDGRTPGRGTGRMVILPVDQGFEHGPARSFAMNPEAYDPHYHYKLAIDAGLSATGWPPVLTAGATHPAG